MASNQEQKVVSAIRDSKKTPDSVVVLSTGVKLKASRVSSMIFMEVTRRFAAPKIPVFHNEDLGRDEENPNDPEYVAEYNKYQTDVSAAIIDTMIVMGTDIVSCPSGIDTPQGNIWDRKLKAIGIYPGTDEMVRYLMWVKYYAAPEDDDMTKIVTAVGKLSGVSEEDVADATDQFRSNT